MRPATASNHGLTRGDFRSTLNVVWFGLLACVILLTPSASAIPTGSQQARVPLRGFAADRPPAQLDTLRPTAESRGSVIATAPFPVWKPLPRPRPGRNMGRLRPGPVSRQPQTGAENRRTDSTQGCVIRAFLY